MITNSKGWPVSIKPDLNYLLGPQFVIDRINKRHEAISNPNAHPLEVEMHRMLIAHDREELHNRLIANAFGVPKGLLKPTKG